MPLVIRTMRAGPGEVEALVLPCGAAVFAASALAGDGARDRSRPARDVPGWANPDDIVYGDGGTSTLATSEIAGKATPA